MITLSSIKPGLQLIWTAIWFNVLTYVGVTSCYIMMILLLMSKYWWIGALYIVWIAIDDKQKRGGRMLFKNLNIMAYYRDYFPVKLIKTVDLDPSKNYIFANYPHGTFAVGAVLSTATNGSDFSSKFPGLQPRLMMHNFFFYVPFYREIMQLFAMCDCSEQSFRYLLDEDRHKGICAVVVVGGAREGILSEPGKHKLIINNRKGFVRVAIQTGASLVPLYSFGETEIFRKTAFEKGGFLNKLQYWVLQTTGLMFLRLSGRVGPPLEVKKNPNPTTEEIDAVHAEFKNRILQLFEAEKPKYLENHENIHIEFV